jgi:hypothetical protein
MTPRTAITQIAKMIGQELGSGAGPSEGALAAGPMLRRLAPPLNSLGGCLLRRAGSARTIA